MKRNYIVCGKIVGTHGVKGAVRIHPWCDSAEFLSNFKVLYFDENGTEKMTVESMKHSKTIAFAKFKDINNIESAEALRNRLVYISREEYNLPSGQYFIADLIDCKVYNYDDNTFLGTICDVSRTGSNDVWHINNNNKEYLIPAIKDVIVSVDIDNGLAVIKPLKGIFDDEN